MTAHALYPPCEPLDTAITRPPAELSAVCTACRDDTDELPDGAGGFAVGVGSGVGLDDGLADGLLDGLVADAVGFDVAPPEGRAVAAVAGAEKSAAGAGTATGAVVGATALDTSATVPVLPRLLDAALTTATPATDAAMRMPLPAITGAIRLDLCTGHPFPHHRQLATDPVLPTYADVHHIGTLRRPNRGKGCARSRRARGGHESAREQSEAISDVPARRPPADEPSYVSASLPAP